ncbi:hypothetical protein [Rhizobium sp. LCM 4573]|uniref:hypothetical protein n=1 Tax=Rhizobium sp. LCM 4573 TaxID=1848291 RepID=UPI0008DA6ACD|nr:hypothetical protein [Rhizobium sp. LCM 4573]OHV83602.1 hypothetical protein LCM4573_05705 [Rhizobium sp. LCM 4573]
MKRPAFTTKALLIGALLLPGTGLAQEPQETRFRLEKTENGGFVRLDTQTGAMTLCRDEGGNLTCRMAADERAAYERELELLEKRVAALEQKSANPPASRVPGEEEIEQTLSIMERFMRRFMAIVQDFTSERNTDEPQPNRT